MRVVKWGVNKETLSLLIQVTCELILSPTHLVRFGYSQLASSMGISYIAMVLPRLMWGKPLKVSQGVMLKVILGGLLRDPLSGKEDRRGVKIRSMSGRKSSLALEKGRFKHTG